MQEDNSNTIYGIVQVLNFLITDIPIVLIIVVYLASILSSYTSSHHSQFL